MLKQNAYLIRFVRMYDDIDSVDSQNISLGDLHMRV